MRIMLRAICGAAQFGSSTNCATVSINIRHLPAINPVPARFGARGDWDLSPLFSVRRIPSLFGGCVL